MGTPLMIRRPEKLEDAVAVILRRLERPASAREIAELGRQDPALSKFFGGKTPYKTLNARLSVDIYSHGESSLFFRYAPAAYGLREFLTEKGYDRAFRRVFVGRNRRKEISNELVATVSQEEVSFFDADGLYPSDSYPLRILDLINVEYCERKKAEERQDIKQLVSYAYIYHDASILAFEKGRYTSNGEEYVGKQSIGFGGHLKHNDLSLFDDNPVGLEANVIREINEELYIISRSLIDNIVDISFRGFLLDSSTENGKKHLGLATAINLKERLDLDNPSLGIRNLRWLSMRSTPNSFDRFEIWSQYLFRHIQRACVG
jgi:predicted NUDIX family phosphoesterase